MFQIGTAGAVTTLTLSHPPVNAISDEWVRTFEAKLDQLGASCAVLHIRSDQKVFCAGAELKEMRGRMDMADGPTVCTPMSPASSGSISASRPQASCSPRSVRRSGGGFEWRSPAICACGQ